MKRSSFVRWMLILSIVSLPLPFISCSGGGGGSPPNGGGSTVQTQSVGISGIVTVNGSQPNDKFNITVKSIDDKGNVIAIERTSTIYNPNQANLNGHYKVNVGLVEGGKAVIIAEGSGYTKATKTINYNGGTDITINLDVKQVTTQTVNISDGISITDSGKKYLRVAFVKDKDTGKLMAKTGIEAQSADPDSKVMDLAIPLGKLQSGTQEVNISLKSYNPSNPDDYQDFPGSETEDGDQLVSFGFDYLEITDQNGNNPFVSSSSISSQLVSGEYFRILRTIDCTQIKNLIKSGVVTDEDSNKAGIQFTFYAFDTDQGVWVTAGQGTFVENNGINYTNSEWDTIIQSGCDPNSTSTDNTDGIAGCNEYGIIQDVKSICGLNQDYVVISVTNPVLEWKNLDYIVPGGSEISCNVTVVDKDTGSPLKGAYVSANASCMAWIDGVTDNDGIVTLTTIGYSNPCTANVSAWYMMKEGTVQADFNGNCNITIEIENPYKCEVKGKVVDENNDPVEGLVVYAFTKGSYTGPQDINSNQYNMFENILDITDKNGNFSIKTKCNAVGSVFAKFSNTKTYNVNGTKDNDEISDNGTTADVGTIQIINDPPYGNIYRYKSPKIGDNYSFDLCAYDLENNYPISYSIIVKKNGADFKTFNGQIDSTDRCKSLSFIPDGAGTYVITGTVKDSKNKEAPLTSTKYFTIDGSNHYISGSLMVFGSYMSSSMDGYDANYAWVYVYGNFNDSNNTHNLSNNLTYDCYDNGGNKKLSGGPQNVTGKTVYLMLSSTDDPNLLESDYCIVNVTTSDGSANLTINKKVLIYGK